MANEDRRRVGLAVSADDSDLGRAQRARLQPAAVQLRPVGVARRRPEIAEGAHVKATCLIYRPAGEIAKALHETIGDVALCEVMSPIEPADIEGVRPPLEVFVRGEIRKVHSVLRRLSGRMRRHTQSGELGKLRRWLRIIRAADQTYDVSQDLQWREDEAPRKAPPAEQHRETEVGELTLSRTRPTREGRCAAPPRQQNGRPHPVADVDVDGTPPTAFRAGPSMESPDLLADDIIGYLQRCRREAASISAALVAVTSFRIAKATKEDERPTIAAASHRPSRYVVKDAERSR